MIAVLAAGPLNFTFDELIAYLTENCCQGGGQCLPICSELHGQNANRAYLEAELE